MYALANFPSLLPGSSANTISIHTIFIKRSIYRWSVYDSVEANLNYVRIRGDAKDDSTYMYHIITSLKVRLRVYAAGIEA